MECFHCNKPIPVPDSGTYVTVTLTQSTYAHSYRIGDIVFHATCFFEVAGDEYRDALVSELNPKSGPLFPQESTHHEK